MDILDVIIELVFARKVDVVVLTVQDWAFEVFGLVAMLGPGVACEVGPAPSDEFAAGLTASPVLRLAVMVLLFLMYKKLPRCGPGAEPVRRILCRPYTTRNAAAKCP